MYVHMYEKWRHRPVRERSDATLPDQLDGLCAAHEGGLRKLLPAGNRPVLRLIEEPRDPQQAYGSIEEAGVQPPLDLLDAVRQGDLAFDPEDDAQWKKDARGYQTKDGEEDGADKVLLLEAD